MGHSEKQGALLEQISNMVVRVYADHLGRGPTKARSFIDNFVVTCILEDTMIRAERTLLAAGRGAQVLEGRSGMQEAMRGQLITEMEGLCGREVSALIAGSELEPDICAQVFVLNGKREV